MTNSAEALILDFGGVISRTMFETQALSEKALGLVPGTLAWKGPFDPESDTLWADMQADLITERDYWLARTKEVGALVGEEWIAMETMVKRARGADVEAIIRPEAVAAIQVAKMAGRKLAILSNELDLFYGADFRSQLPLLDLFDVIVDASYTKILKPEERAYRDCIDKLGLPPTKCVFVDDQARNIVGAKKVGLQTVHFDVKEPLQSFNHAMKMLGLPKIAEFQPGQFK